MSTITDRIRTLLSQGDLEEGLQAAADFLRGRNDDLYDECLQHQGKISENNRNLRLGIIPQSDVDLTRNRVRFALLEVVKIIDRLHPEPAPTPAPPVVIEPPVAAAPAPAPTLADPEAAANLLQQLLRVLTGNAPETAAQQTVPLLHKSLLQNGVMQPVFKINNFFPAYQSAHLYANPPRIVQSKSTNRRSIGILNDREEGEEFVFTLAKQEDNGGMPGMVRLFFSKNGGRPTITNISL